MKSIIAGVIAISLHILGFAIGCGIWAVIGWGLGSAFSHAPVSGALTGLAYQLGCYVYLHNQMWAGIQRSHAKFVYLLDQVIA